MTAFDMWKQKALDATAKISDAEDREVVEADIATL
jgi:hypothetical protein